METKSEVLIYRKKLKTYSDDTLRLITRMNDTSERRQQKVAIVLESKTEEEVVAKLKKLNAQKI